MGGDYEIMVKKETQILADHVISLVLREMFYDRLPEQGFKLGGLQTKPFDSSYRLILFGRISDQRLAIKIQIVVVQVEFGPEVIIYLFAVETHPFPNVQVRHQGNTLDAVRHFSCR